MRFKAIFKKKANWKTIEYFNPEWKERIRMMAELLPPDTNSITDLGCGLMWLKEFIPTEVNYIGVDYTSRGKGTIVCDFNKKQFPKISSDIAFVSGCLEYVKDASWFVKKIADNYKGCIISYCVLEEFKDQEFRDKKTWVNSFTENDIIQLFNKEGFNLKKKLDTKNRIFYFEK